MKDKKCITKNISWYYGNYDVIKNDQCEENKLDLGLEKNNENAKEFKISESETNNLENNIQKHVVQWDNITTKNAYVRGFKLHISITQEDMEKCADKKGIHLVIHFEKEFANKGNHNGNRFVHDIAFHSPIEKINDDTSKKIEYDDENNPFILRIILRAIGAIDTVEEQFKHWSF